MPSDFTSLCLWYHDWGSAADGNGSCHALAASFFEEVIRCWHQKLHWQWPGNPNGQSKFHNLRLFTFTRSQLMFLGFWRLPKIAQTAHSRCKKHCRWWSGSIEILQLRKFVPARSSKTSRKNIFLLLGRRHYDDIAHCFFSYYHSQQVLFLPMKNKFSTTVTPPKNQEIHIEEFFVDSIYRKTIDIMRKNFVFYF